MSDDEKCNRALAARVTDWCGLDVDHAGQCRPATAVRSAVWMVETSGVDGRCVFVDKADADRYAALIGATAKEAMPIFEAGTAPMTYQVWHATASVGTWADGLRRGPRPWVEHRSELSGGTPACVLTLDNYNGVMVVAAEGTDKAAVEAAVADRYAKLCAAFEAPLVECPDPRAAS